MGIFRKGGRSRQVPTEPLPDWDDTRWRAHLRANAIGTDHHTTIYQDMIDTDRKEAARHFKNEDDSRARSCAESALAHKRIVSALAALSPLSNALYQRSEPLAGYTSLVQIPEPARSGIVTIIFAAGRLDLSYLTDTVTFLREQFGSVHIDLIQRSDGELFNLVNPSVRDALSPAPADRPDIDAELASAVKEYFGIAVPPSAQPQTGSNAALSGPPGAASHSSSASHAQSMEQHSARHRHGSSASQPGLGGVAQAAGLAASERAAAAGNHVNAMFNSAPTANSSASSLSQQHMQSRGSAAAMMLPGPTSPQLVTPPASMSAVLSQQQQSQAARAQAQGAQPQQAQDVQERLGVPDNGVATQMPQPPALPSDRRAGAQSQNGVQAPTSPVNGGAPSSMSSSAPTPPYAGPAAPERTGGGVAGKRVRGVSDAVTGAVSGTAAAVGAVGASVVAGAGVAASAVTSNEARAGSAASGSGSMPSLRKNVNRGGGVHNPVRGGRIDDSDEALIARYRHMRAVIAV